MPLFRQTMIFAQVVGDTFANINGQVWGWSENWVTDRASIQDAQTNLQSLAPRRAKLLGVNTTLEFLRSQFIGSPRQTVLSRWHQSGPPASGDSDIPNTAVLYRLNTDMGVQRSYLLRGIPDQYITEGGGFFPTAPWPANATNFFTNLAAFPNGALIQVFGAGQPVQSIVQAAGSPNVTIEVVDGTPFLVGNFLNIKGPRTAGAPQVRGKHKIVGKTGNFLTIKVSFVVNPAYDAFAKGLNCFPVTPTFSQFGDAELRYSTHRITGRPLYLPRGRKPKRA